MEIGGVCKFGRVMTYININSDYISIPQSVNIGTQENHVVHSNISGGSQYRHGRNSLQGHDLYNDETSQIEKSSKLIWSAELRKTLGRAPGLPLTTDTNSDSDGSSSHEEATPPTTPSMPRDTHLLHALHSRTHSLEKAHNVRMVDLLELYGRAARRKVCGVCCAS